MSAGIPAPWACLRVLGARMRTIGLPPVCTAASWLVNGGGLAALSTFSYWLSSRLPGPPVSSGGRGWTEGSCIRCQDCVPYPVIPRLLSGWAHGPRPELRPHHSESFFSRSKRRLVPGRRPGGSGGRHALRGAVPEPLASL